MNRVTTLIPVYNGAQYVGNAIRSVLAQSHPDVEVIVIDDGSTDDTPQVLSQFGDAIRVLRQQNSGHVRSRNNGARIATGNWLAFLDADDEWEPTKLASQLALADESVGLVYTDRRNIGETHRIWEFGSQFNTLWDGDIFEPLLFGNFVTVSSAVIRREWFERLSGFDADLLVCEDWDMWLRFAGAGGRTAVCREPLTRYRWHADSMTYNQQRMCDGRLKVVERALASARGRQLPHAVARRSLAATWQTSAWYAEPTERWNAFKWYVRACLYWPWNLAAYKGMVKCCLARS
jgi:glycosyltransferase involved in cell wall biosynthesis